MTEPTERPPDHPPVPRPRTSPFAIVMLVLSLLASAGYGAVAYSEHEFAEPAHDVLPATVRASPGGYRSFHFWHSGYHGGK